MVIWFTFHYGKCSVKLLNKDRSDHLVGECHSRERNLGIAPLAYCFRKSVRASNDEYDVLASI